MSYPYTPPPPARPPAYYPPSGYPPAGPPQMAPRPPGRSAIPRVVGILAIVFSVIGLLMSLAMTFGPKEDLERWQSYAHDRIELGFLATWLDIFLILSIALFALHLAGGIAAVAYKRSGPALITIYAIFAIVLTVADVLVSVSADVSPGYVMEEVVVPRIGLGVLALIWPIVALVLMNLKGAKRACRGES